jgi:dienelactone hydrolase
MTKGVDAAVARFLWRFTHAAQDAAHERELLIHDGGKLRPVTAFVPDGWPTGRPAWILLHGITVPGRHHDALRRMARSLAAAGHYAVVPEIESWRRLRVDPAAATRTIRATLAHLETMVPADSGRVGVMGFSVAGRWAITATAEFPNRVRAVASMGGYWDIERTIVAMITGEHEWQRRQYRYSPDPYGRWIMGANLLPLLTGERFGSHDERVQVAAGLRQLAETAGQNGAMAREPVYDGLNTSLRGTLPHGARPIWDLLAPLSTEPVATQPEAHDLARAMAGAAAATFPELISRRGIDELTVPTVLVHGKTDRLIPFTETLRLAEHLPATAVRRVTITGLFGHTRSREAQPLRNPVRYVREAQRFAETIGDLLAAVESPR